MDEELDKLEESYKLSIKEELLFDKTDLESTWKHGYQTAWARLSTALLLMVVLNLAFLGTIAFALIMLWLK